MLASVYSYRVMVKSVSSCCVRGSRVLSNPVTYGGRFTISTTQIGSEPVTSVLEIDNFQPGDVGTYTCTSTNRVGETTGSIELAQR